MSRSFAHENGSAPVRTLPRDRERGPDADPGGVGGAQRNRTDGMAESEHARCERGEKMSVGTGCEKPSERSSA